MRVSGFSTRPAGRDVFACNARGFVADVLATSVNFRHEVPHNVRVLVADVVGFPDVRFEVVECPDFQIVFADVEFPSAAAHGFDAVAFVIKKGFVLRFRAGFRDHERANVFAVDDAIRGHICASEGRERGIEVQRQREFHTHFARGDFAGPAHEARNALPPFPSRAFGGAQRAVAAAFVSGARTVIAGEDDEGIVVEPQRFEFVKNDRGGPVDAGHRRAVHPFSDSRTNASGG